ncbi:hypothetical protein ACRALDRAFT_212868 [Sodiomyces alcalophilus JCM 7366]|uniref:uncharacterized protein n=1 Tax=Sodiomyces alcalophilus JCM 7366 TaxID=591952 RepID=UPI0039B6D364
MSQPGSFRGFMGSLGPWEAVRKEEISSGRFDAIACGRWSDNRMDEVFGVYVNAFDLATRRFAMCAELGIGVGRDEACWAPNAENNNTCCCVGELANLALDG